MSLTLKNKHVLITGSTDGLGKKLASALLAQGAHVIIHGRNAKKISKTIDDLKSQQPSAHINSIECDLTTPLELQKSLAPITELDVLINCAGVWLEGDTVDATPEKINELVQVNLSAPLMTTRILLPVLQKSTFAQILNISSIAGVEIPADYWHTIYSATKFGVQAFSEALAKEFDGKNIRVMGYYPGGMQTDLFKKAGNTYKDNEPWMFDPHESVEAILFMLTRNPKINIKRMDLINHLQE